MYTRPCTCVDIYIQKCITYYIQGMYEHAKVIT